MTFASKAEETYQLVSDDNVSCALLLRTVGCLAENGRAENELDSFRDYLKETKACSPLNAARLSIDNVVQVYSDDAILSEIKPVDLDVFVRNSGDLPALITSLTARFDEHLRPPRAPADMQEVSTVYTVAIDSTGAKVRGAQLNSPAKAFFPSPGSPVFIIETPIAQTLGPRSSDRFRIKLRWLGGTEVRGPREQVSIDLNFNDGETVTYKPIAISPQDNSCFRIFVNDQGTMVPKEICR